MSDTPLSPREDSSAPALPSSWQALRERTPARVLCGRAGPSYATSMQLELRRDHAFALDAVHAELDLARDLGGLVREFKLFEVGTEAATKEEFLRRPDLGRRLSDAAADTLGERCAPGRNLQVVIGDGLSATAVARQVPEILPRLRAAATKLRWTFGQPFVVRHCRVGALNDVGALLRPEVVVLLIGERPGLATSESLSAYLAYRPQPGHTDAQRNLISNIHDRGVSPDEAVTRVMRLAQRMRDMKTSGTALKES